MRRQLPIDRPIFIVGCGRSGTTVVYDILCSHPELAWFSTYTGRWPWVPQLAVASRIYPWMRRRGRLVRGAPVPSEGYAFWDEIRPPAERDNRNPLTQEDVRPGEAERAERIIANHLRFQGKGRFINKNTRNIRRLRYLNALFPTARFLHIIRDPRATTASLLKVSWWPDLPIWCLHDQTPRQWVASGNREETIAAEFWKREIEVALEHKMAIPQERYMELRYEDLTYEPEQNLRNVLQYLELSWTTEFDRAFRRFALRDSNAKYGSQLTDVQIKEVDRITGALATKFGYDVDGSPRA